MNFYNNKLQAKQFLNIHRKYKKNFSKNFLIQNFGLFSGDKSMYKLLKCFEIVKQIKDVKGSIIEFGVWNGNNLITIKKIIDYLRINKKIIGYDNFKGMIRKNKKNSFIGDLKLIKYIIKFFNLKNIELIKDDIIFLKKNLNKIPKLSLIYIDCDIYSTTKNILKLLPSKLNKGGLIVFDEALFKRGEGKAANEFYKKNSKFYKKIYLKKNYQPDLIFKKI